MSNYQQWYYINKKYEEDGPVSSDELQEMATNGDINRGTYVWTAELEEWIPASKIGGLFPEEIKKMVKPLIHEEFNKATGKFVLDTKKKTDKDTAVTSKINNDTHSQQKAKTQGSSFITTPAEPAQPTSYQPTAAPKPSPGFIPPAIPAPASSIPAPTASPMPASASSIPAPASASSIPAPASSTAATRPPNAKAIPAPVAPSIPAPGSTAKPTFHAATPKPATGAIPAPAAMLRAAARSTPVAITPPKLTAAKPASFSSDKSFTSSIPPIKPSGSAVDLPSIPPVGRTVSAFNETPTSLLAKADEQETQSTPTVAPKPMSKESS